MPTDLWIRLSHPNPQATVRLFCLPYAGGGSSIFRLWPQMMPNNVELGAFVFPGRENRRNEPPISDLKILIEHLVQALLPYSDKPLTIFGHSMGSIVGYELAKALEARNIQPAWLFVSGSAGPQVPDSVRSLHLLSDEQFIEALSRRYQAIPDVILNDKALLEIMLPILRADIKLLETYAYEEATPLNCPILACGSFEDPEATLQDITTWQKHTRTTFLSHMFPGDHFYLNSQRPLLVSCLAEILTRLS